MRRAEGDSRVLAMTWAWLRIDMRRRWRSLAVLAVLVAVAGTTVLASVAGARRGESALPRLAARTLPATAAVLPNEPGFDWDRVRAFPEVEVLATILLGIPFVVDGVPGDEGGLSVPPGDDSAMRTIERPVVFEGRLPDPSRADEAFASPLYLRHHNLRVGDTRTLSLYSPRQVKATGPQHEDPGPPEGPKLQVRIVGVGIAPWGNDTPGSKGSLAISSSSTGRTSTTSSTATPTPSSGCAAARPRCPPSSSGSRP